VTFNASLDALAAQPTVRVAGLRPITQELITSTVHKVFPEIDTTIEEWTTAHGDLAWSNLTSPDCWFLDREDWGTAPRGYDAAVLRTESLAVPDLADRVYQEREADLATRSGQLSQLFQCSKSIAEGQRAGVLLEPARELAETLVKQLQA
jgi:hypothetical protein